MAVRALAVVALLAAPGCFWVTTKSEGQGLRRDVKDLQGRVAKQEETVDAKVKQLDESLEKATALLKRNSADVGAEVEALAKDMATLNGNVEQLRRDMAELQTKLAESQATNQALRDRLAAAEARLEALDKQKPPPPPDKDALFAGAKQKFDAGQWTDARKDFRAYVTQFPRDAKADDAQWYVGETFYKEKAYEKAIAEYQKVIDVYGDADYADDAFLQAGNAAIEMKFCTDAKAYFFELTRRYPKSDLVKKAKDRLDYVKKNEKKKSVCQT